LAAASASRAVASWSRSAGQCIALRDGCFFGFGLGVPLGHSFQLGSSLSSTRFGQLVAIG
jgi:hypothetical protein